MLMATVLCLLACLSAIFVSAETSEAKFTLVPSVEEARIGDRVTVSLTASDIDFDIFRFSAKLTWDSSKLKAIGSEWGDMLVSSPATKYKTADGDLEKGLLSVTLGRTGAAVFVRYDEKGREITLNAGTILTLSFTVLDKASPENTVSLTLETAGLSKTENRAQDVFVGDGVIRLASPQKTSAVFTVVAPTEPVMAGDNVTVSLKAANIDFPVFGFSAQLRWDNTKLKATGAKWGDMLTESPASKSKTENAALDGGRLEFVAARGGGDVFVGLDEDENELVMTGGVILTLSFTVLDNASLKNPVTLSVESIGESSEKNRAGDIAIENAEIWKIEPLSSLSLKEAGKTEYYRGEGFLKEDFVFEASFGEEYQREIGCDEVVFSKTEEDFLDVSVSTVSASYSFRGVTRSVEIPVTVLKILSDLSVTPFTKRVYRLGDSPDYSGLAVEAIYVGGSRENVTDSVLLSPARDAKLALTDSAVTLSYSYDGVTKNAEVSIAVKPVVSGVSLDASPSVLALGKTMKLTAAVTPTDAYDPSVTWSSSDPAILSVNEMGEVTAHTVGKATITVRTNDGGFTATREIEAYNPFDCNRDGIINVLDVMRLAVAFREGSTDLIWDLDEDNLLSADDLITLIEKVMDEMLSPAGNQKKDLYELEKD